MSAYRQLAKAQREAESDSKRTGEPTAVVEWMNPHKTYLVRTLVKAQHMVEKHMGCQIVARYYPDSLPLDGDA